MKTKNYIGEKEDLNAQVTTMSKQKKIWIGVGIGGGLLLIGVLIWVFTKD